MLKSRSGNDAQIINCAPPYTLNKHRQCVKCFVSLLITALWSFSKLFVISGKKNGCRRGEAWRGWGGCIFLSWLFLGLILARAGTVCTEPHCGGEVREDIFSTPLYTWPMDTINTLIDKDISQGNVNVRVQWMMSKKLFLCKCWMRENGTMGL